jgi:arylsulfatase A-like enzyme
LQAAGYRTAMCGKWHLGSFDPAYWPTGRGFDHHYGHLFGAIDYYTHQRDGKLDWYRNGQLLKEEGYSTHLLAREAVRLIRAQPKNQPLFLYVAFNAVHAPHQVPESYKAPYTALKEPRRTYAGMLAAMDEAVGQIVAAIDDTGRRTNTLFIFSSDNGGPAPGRVTDNGPLRAGKGTLYEGGVRVCALAAWPGHIPAGRTIQEPLHIVDWYPTLRNLTGASRDQQLPLDGRDLWPVLTAGKPSPHDEILLNAAPNQGALRVGDWKLVLNGGIQNDPGEGPGAADGAAPAARPRRAARSAFELFHLRDDPRETNNLATARPEKLKELRARYQALARQAAPPKNQPAGP